MKIKTITFIIPVYNQADHIEEIMREYIAALDHVACDKEYILVVNGNNDGCLDICKQLETAHSTIRVIHSLESGWGLAIKLGLAEASGDFIGYLNSARTSATELASLVLYALSNPEVIIKANRKIREGWGRRLASLAYNIECRTLFDLSCWDVNGTPKIFPRKFSTLLNLTCDDDLIDLEFNTIVRQESYPMLEVPVFSSRRHGGKSTTSIKSAFRLYFGAFKMRFMKGSS